jgi:hypothetical protein
MKRTVWTFGLIAGIIAAAFCVVSIGYCYTTQTFEGNMYLGFASQLLAFSFVFVGIKNYRDKYSNGTISFLTALKVGGLIMFIASSIYVLVWLVDYYVFIPDFLEKFAAAELKRAQANGASAAEFKEQARSIEEYKEYYRTPFGIILCTYIEIIPMGIVVTLVSALILKRKLKAGHTVTA